MAVFGVSGTDVNEAREGALRGILQQTAGGAANADKAIALAQQLYPDTPKADPYEAAFQFFAEMGRQASQPGATALGSAVGSMQVPMDYLNAKKKEAEETERARMTTALSLGPSLKPKPAAAGSYDWVVDEDGNTLRLSNSEIIKRQAAGETLKPYEKPSATTSTFKERKFFRTGFDPVVVKNETDAASFEADPNWSSLPPADWVNSKGETDEDAAEVQASSILDGGVVVTVMKDGTTKVLDAAGVELEGDARAEAIREAEDRGIQIQTERAGGRRAATVAVNTSLSAFDQVGKSRSNIANLEEAKRLSLIGEFAAGIAHEVNNPLAVIHSKAQLLEIQLNQLTEKKTESIENIIDSLESIKRMTLHTSDLIKNLKTFSSKANFDQLELTKITDVLDMVLKISQNRCSNAGIKVAINVDPNLKLNCNPSGLAQVILNLISNSIDAIEYQKDKWINIETKLSNKTLKIIITDSGGGISDEIVEKITQPFFSTKDPGKGTGLGLSISSKSIEKMKGKFYYNSESENTQFVIEFKSFEV